MNNPESKPSNLNLKITEDERWDFKEFCVHHRMSQVDGFRLAFSMTFNSAYIFVSGQPVKDRHLSLLSRNLHQRQNTHDLSI